jgi:hypothetical protein
MAEDPEDRPTAAQFRDQLAALNLSAKLAPKALTTTETAGDGPSPSRPEKPAAVKIESATGSPSSRWERRGLVTLVVAAALIVVASMIALVNLATRTPAVEPTPSLTSQAPVSPSRTPVVVPAGFVDCSGQLGMDTYCASRPECWAGVIGYSDIPSLGTRQDDCTKTHVYQTFLAGRLTYDVRRQSQLDSDAHVRRVCTGEIANSMLGSRDRRSDWEIIYLGPQQPNEYFFRCIIGRGERTQPLEFHAPG